MNKKIPISTFHLVCLFAGLLTAPSAIFAQERPVSDTSIYAYLHPELNSIQFYNSSSLKRLSSKWSNGGSLSIAHIGDSHVQPDVYPGTVRKNLQSLRGDAGRGMVFPYSIAKTYSASDYKSTYTGNWKCARSIEYAPKLPLGASGITCHTLDKNAGFKLIFKTPLSETNRIIKVFCKKSKSSYDFILRTANQELLVVVDDTVNSGQPFIELELPCIGDTIEVALRKQNIYETEFEFYGMSLESKQKEGLLYHSMGIGGSKYGSVLAQKLFQDQLPSLRPDLVIIDFGTNDYLYTDEIPETMEAEIKNVIRKVRFSVPEADLLLTTPHDMNRRGINVRSGEAFSELIKKVAKEENCAFYDWFWVAGGPRIMTCWQEMGLTKDMIHLTKDGSMLKGELLTSAFQRTFSMLQTMPQADSLIFPLDSLKRIAKAGDTLTVPEPKPIVYAKATGTINHVVKTGETLGAIARKYHVTVASIMAQNGLKNTNIRVGRTLKINVKKR